MKLLPLLACLLLSGCLNYGPEMREKARVTQSHFVAPHTTVSIGHESTTSPEYWVAFECEHGQFAVSDQDTWQRVKTGETWIVVYKEGKNDKGVVMRYQFLRVEPATQERSR